ncbi:hypothetical protein AVEN_255962-1 [Araneus ventricosus]|uniref:Uncharacterized protein n=1 Tax=Araneus ventricosus TaxID=182803 RepID=A0A4Y2UM75_ARAVE|nr:hypothetical protein AVEN_157442-1 [Araneus ventricosus]GBO13232.1 hypothetical protein AVEN_255962-1 [Araneus ventricosus]
MSIPYLSTRIPSETMKSALKKAFQSFILTTVKNLLSSIIFNSEDYGWKFLLIRSKKVDLLLDLLVFWKHEAKTKEFPKCSKNDFLQKQCSRRNVLPDLQADP